MALLDAHGKEITIGCAVKRVSGAFGSEAIAHVTEIRGRVVLVDVVTEITVDEQTGRAIQKRRVTVPPVYLGSLVEVVA